MNAPDQWEIEQASLNPEERESWHEKGDKLLEELDRWQNPPDPVDPWGDVLPPEMQEQWIPAPFAPYMKRLADKMGVDLGILVMFLLGCCAGLVTDEIRLKVRPDLPRWLEACCLWIMVVGNSGTKKTPALNQITSIIYAIERKKREEAISELENFDMRMKIWEKKKEKYISEQAGPNPSSQILEEKPGPKPVKHRIIVGNATVEALQDICDAQVLRGVLGVRDEIVSLFTSANEYKKGGSDMQELLEGWNCAPHPVDRKGRDTMIQEYGFSLVGGTQPRKIAEIIQKLHLDSDGALQRFTPYIARQATTGQEESQVNEEDEEAYFRFRKLLNRLYAIAPTNAGVKFSAQAQQTRKAFADWTERIIASDIYNDAIKSHLSKYEAFFNRFCLTYYAIQCADTDEAHAFIGTEIPQSIALQVQDLFQNCLFQHADYFYSNTVSDGSGSDWERQFLDYVLSRDLHQVSSTAIAQTWTWYKRNISQLKNPKIVTDYWQQQVNAGYIRPIGGTDRTHTRATLFEVNWKLFDGRFAHRQQLAKAAHEKAKSNPHPAFIAQQQPRQAGED